MKKHLFLGTALLTAMAGTAMGTVAHADTVAAPAAQDATSDAGKITVVTVTATKRSTNLQKTPIAISVLSSAALGDRHAESLLALADGSVPALRVATFEARQSALTIGIRGIVPFDQNQTARDTPVGVYIDNVYQGRSQGLNAALFDVQRIEILRGPQGTLFGRNTEGGALSIITKDPTGDFGGRIVAGTGNFASKTLQAHIDLPEAYNFALKFDTVYEHQDPTVKNILPGQAGWNQYDRTGARLSAKWTPTDKLTGIFSIDTSRDENTPNYSQLINYNPNGLTVGTATGNIAPLPASVFVSGRTRMKAADIGVPQQVSLDRSEGAAATLTYKLAPNIDLKSITGYRRVTTDQWDNSGGAHRTPGFASNVAGSPFSRYSLSFLKQSQVSQEFQLVGNTAEIDYVAGLYYFNEHVSEFAATPSTNLWNPDGSYTIASENYTGAITSSKMGWASKAQMFIARDAVTDTTSAAAFGQATWTPAGFNALHITLGGRYTNDKRDGALTKINNVATPFVLHYKKSNFDPLAIAAFDVSPDVHVYAKYSTGFRAGGANNRSFDFRAFNPETVKATELGAKLDLLDHKLRLNLAVYQMDREDAQLDDSNVDPLQFLSPGVANPNFNKNVENTYNAPNIQKIKGFEAELLVKPTENLTLGFNYSYTDTPPLVFVNTKTNAVTGVVTTTSTTFYTVFTPKSAASANIDYSKSFGGDGRRFVAHLDGNYADPQYSFQNENVKTDRSFVVNGRLAIADIPLQASGSKLTVALWSRNLLDTTYIYRRSDANNSTLGSYGNFNPPRTVGIEANISF